LEHDAQGDAIMIDDDSEGAEEYDDEEDDYWF
jgi:hypothetical protein